MLSRNTHSMMAIRKLILLSGIFFFFNSLIENIETDFELELTLFCIKFRNFWEVVLEFPLELQKKLLHFATGSDRVPVGGMGDLNFKISKSEASTNW